MHRRRALAVLATALLAVGGVAAHGTLHGTHTTPRAQVVGNGEVVIDAVALNQEGFVVVRRDDGGRPGEPIGSRALEPGIHEDVRVSLEASLGNGTTPLWAAVHTDDGDGTFEPGEDPAVQGVVGVAASPFEVRTGEGSVYVLGRTERSQQSEDSVLVNSVALNEPGHLVVFTDDRGRLGEPIGNVSLPAGTHYNVVVDVNASAYPDDREFFSVWAVAFHDDGDGTFDRSADGMVTVGEDPVASRIGIQKVEGPVDRTTVAMPTTAGDGGTETGEDDPATASGTGGPGFGVVPAVLAVVALLATARRRGSGE